MKVKKPRIVICDRCMPIQYNLTAICFLLLVFVFHSLSLCLFELLLPLQQFMLVVPKPFWFSRTHKVTVNVFPLVATTHYFPECLKIKKTMFTCVWLQFYTLHDFLPNSVHTLQQSRSQEFESGWAEVISDKCTDTTFFMYRQLEFR